MVAQDNQINEQTWYEEIGQDVKRNKFYSIFMDACRKYGVNWATAEQKDNDFIEAFTRFSFAHWEAEEYGLPVDNIPPLFDI